MSAIEVTLDLPFYIRVRDALTVPYEKVCQEARLKELKGHNLEITFSQRAAGAIDKSDLGEEAVLISGVRTVIPKKRTSVSVKVETPSDLSDESVGTFAIRNCLEILNRVITSYQAATGEVNNVGFIFPLGTTDMQLFAGIQVNGKDFRDRWPSHSINTMPLSADQAKDFQRYLTGQEGIPLSRLFITSAILSLERGQYPLAILQAATAVELKVTQVVSRKLRAAGWSDQAIKRYEREMTLGRKLQIPQTDPRSLETYFSSVSGFAATYKRVRHDLTPLRNCVAHRGYLASHKEAIDAVQAAREFLGILG